MYCKAVFAASDPAEASSVSMTTTFRAHLQLSVHYSAFSNCQCLALIKGATLMSVVGVHWYGDTLAVLWRILVSTYLIPV